LGGYRVVLGPRDQDTIILFTVVSPEL